MYHDVILIDERVNLSNLFLDRWFLYLILHLNHKIRYFIIVIINSLLYFRQKFLKIIKEWKINERKVYIECKFIHIKLAYVYYSLKIK